MADGGTGGGLLAGGSAGGNELLAGSGSATIFGGGAGDALFADGAAPDLLVAGAGNETLSGIGSTGANVFFGGSGADLIGGGAGSEMFVAGSGTATILGGSGADLYGFRNGFSSGGRDIVQGFNAAKGDAVVLAGYSAGEGRTRARRCHDRGRQHHPHAVRRDAGDVPGRHQPRRRELRLIVTPPCIAAIATAGCDRQAAMCSN